VYDSTVGPPGTLGAWTATTALPAARAFSQAVVATGANSSVSGAGYLYVLGGATDSTGTPSATIYRGTIASDGTISGWTTLSTALPAPLHSFGAAIFFGSLYIWGGATTGNVPVKTVYRSSIDAAGALAAGWVVNGTALGKTRSKHTAGIASGSVLVTAGLYTGAATGSSENTYATINVDGSVGSFGGATGSNTIQSRGGGNVFNQAEAG